VHAEELLVHDGAEGEGVEGVHDALVGIEVVFVLAFFFEGEVLCEVAALMVAPEHEEGVFVEDFVDKHEDHALDGEVASVDVVAQEEVAGGRGAAPDVEELEEVVVLAVDVSADC